MIDDQDYESIGHSERHRIYVDLLKEIEKGLQKREFVKTNGDIHILQHGCAGMCDLAENLFEIYDITDLKELYAKKPERCSESHYWFPATEDGWNKRIEILKQCIEETK